MTDEFASDLAQRVDTYIERMFAPPDEALRQGLEDAEKAGLPAINVSANEGKLLYLIIRIARAKRVLEIGLLADNVIRGGHVLQDEPADVPTRGVKAFNAAMAAHPRLDSLILPLIRETGDCTQVGLATEARRHREPHNWSFSVPLWQDGSTAPHVCE